MYYLQVHENQMQIQYFNGSVAVRGSFSLLNCRVKSKIVGSNVQNTSSNFNNELSTRRRCKHIEEQVITATRNTAYRERLIQSSLL